MRGGCRVSTCHHRRVKGTAYRTAGRAARLFDARAHRGAPAWREAGDRRREGAILAGFWRCRFSSRLSTGSGHLLASECEAHDGLHVDSAEVELKSFELEGTGSISSVRLRKEVATAEGGGATEFERVAAYAREGT